VTGARWGHHRPNRVKDGRRVSAGGQHGALFSQHRMPSWTDLRRPCRVPGAEMFCYRLSLRSTATVRAAISSRLPWVLAVIARSRSCCSLLTGECGPAAKGIAA